MTAIEQFELPALPAPDPNRRRQPRQVICTRANYLASCRDRYCGWPLVNAAKAWSDFEEHRPAFLSWMEHYKADPILRVGDKCHNPEGTLSALVWVMQTSLNPDRSCLSPCLDFHDRSQKVFVRHGLIIYLTLLLKEVESEFPEGNSGGSPPPP